MALRALAAYLPALILLSSTPSRAAQEDEPTTLVYPVFGHSWGVHRATPALLRLYMGDRVHFDDPQGLAVTRLYSWDNPATQTDDDEITAYGVNSGESNILYNTSMYTLGVFGRPGSGEGEFDHPRGIAADPFGNVYVADTGNHRVVHLWNSGRELAFAASMGSRGVRPGEFEAPRQVALDSRGDIYVTDWGNNRVQVLGYDGKLKAVLGHIPRPDGIAVNDSSVEWSYHKEYALYVSAGDRRQILRLDRRGRIVGSTYAGDLPVAGARFAYLALDYYDNLYATDPVNHCIHKFDRDLNYIVSYGCKGTKGTGQFLSPRGIAIWRRFGQVLIAEERGAQYYWVGCDLRDLEATYLAESDVIRVSFRLTEYAYVDIEVFSGDRLVRRLWSKVIGGTAPRSTHWDLKDDRGVRVPAGVYTVQVTVEPTYSSYRHFKKGFRRSVEAR